MCVREGGRRKFGEGVGIYFEPRRGGDLIFVHTLKGEVNFLLCLTSKHFNNCYKKTVFKKNNLIWVYIYMSLGEGGGI